MENFLGVLGENLGLAGVVLLLNRRDKRDSCSFVMQVDRLMSRNKGLLTLREVLTKRCCVLKIRLR